jgi:hypothetical protein
MLPATSLIFPDGARIDVILDEKSDVYGELPKLSRPGAVRSGGAGGHNFANGSKFRWCNQFL